jgi:hypothetical protein
MSTITITRAATADEMGAEIDRRGEIIERLETDLRHWREECGKLHSQLERFREKRNKITATLILSEVALKHGDVRDGTLHLSDAIKLMSNI